MMMMMGVGGGGGHGGGRGGEVGLKRLVGQSAVQHSRHV